MTGCIAVSLGILWEGSKYMFTPVAVKLIRQSETSHILSGLGMLGLTVVLVIGSVLASLGFFLQTDASAKEDRLQRSEAYRRASSKLVSIDSEIALVQEAAKKYIHNTYTTRGAHLLKTIPALKKERAVAEFELSTLQKHSHDTASPFFTGLASLIDADETSSHKWVKTIKVTLFTILAIMLELISLTSLLILRTSFDCTENSTNDMPKKGGTNHSKPLISLKQKRTCEGRGDTGTLEEGINTRYRVSKKMILSKEISPTIRAIKHAVNVSQDVAKRFLLDLAKEGILRQTGKGRYVLS